MTRTVRGVAWESAVVVRVPALRDLCAESQPFEVTFARTARFRRVLYLVDEALAPLLPIELRIDAAQLYLFDGRRRSEDASLPFAASR